MGRWRIPSQAPGVHSTNKVYQHQWAMYFQWCKSRGISSSQTSINNICLFLRFLRYRKKFSVSCIKGYKSMLVSVLRHKGLFFSKDPDIKDVIQSFEREIPNGQKPSVAWNLDVVLRFLRSEEYEPTNSLSLLRLTKRPCF